MSPIMSSSPSISCLSSVVITKNTSSEIPPSLNSTNTLTNVNASPTESNNYSSISVIQNLEQTSKKRSVSSVSASQLTKLTSSKNISPNQSGRRLSMSKIISLMCSQCGKSFENRCKLTRHLIDHKMAQSPYRCPFSNCLQCYDSRLKFDLNIIVLNFMLFFLVFFTKIF